MDRDQKERKRHDLVEENPQEANHKLNEDRIKWLAFIDKKLQKYEAKAYITNVDDAMLAYD